MNPRDNPKEHKRMSGDYNDDEDETEAMEENTNAETDGGETDMNALNVHVLGEQQYRVGNPAEGTAYTVHMEDPEHEGVMTCTCPDYRFRAADNEHRACKHIQACLAAGPAHVTVEMMTYEHLKREYQILSEKVNGVSQQLTNVTANVSADTGTASENRTPTDEQYVNAGDAAGSGQQMQEVSEQEAAEKLQDAFDNATKGMRVEAAGGKVWVNKSPDAPDYTFNAFLSGPERMNYDPDDPSAPGQYFKNYIDPSDVDAYISEVLE